MNELFENNYAEIIGEVTSEFEYDHEILGQRFYKFYVTTKRLSGNTDIIPVILPEKLIKNEQSIIGEKVRAAGQYRSYNSHKFGKTHLILYLFAYEFELIEKEDVNKIIFEGFLCKEPTYKVTLLGRNISDVIIAVNRHYRKTDYIPCIVWGINAFWVKNIEVGTKVKVEGRIQSRDYTKNLDDGTWEIRTAYEVSVNKIDVVNEKEEEE